MSLRAKIKTCSLGLQWLPRQAAPQDTRLGRLVSFADFCALSVAGELWHTAPTVAEIAQLRAFVRDARMRLIPA